MNKDNGWDPTGCKHNQFGKLILLPVPPNGWGPPTRCVSASAPPIPPRGTPYAPAGETHQLGDGAVTDAQIGRCLPQARGLPSPADTFFQIVVKTLLFGSQSGLHQRPPFLKKRCSITLLSATRQGDDLVEFIAIKIIHLNVYVNVNV